MGLAVDWATLREIAVAAEVDPRTVQRYLRGDKVSGLCARRIRRAIEMSGRCSELVAE